MATIYTDQQKKDLRLNVCRNCPLAKCNSGIRATGITTCNLSDTLCSLDNINILTKTSNPNSSCQRGYWNFTNGTKPKSCGCGG